MKKVLTAITIACLALTLSAGAFAQSAGPKGGLQDSKGGQKGQGKGERRGFGMMRGKGMEEIYSKLGLSADQRKRLDALQKSTSDKMQALGIGGKRSQPGAAPPKMSDRKAMMDKVRPIIEAHQKGVKDILTDAQEKKMETLMKEMREKRMKERGGNGGPAGATKGGKVGGTKKGGGGGR